MFSMGPGDRATIKAVLAGDKEAYGVLVKRHSQKLFRLAYRMTGNQADADDVVQEAFLRGYLRLKSFRSRSDFGTWILPDCRALRFGQAQPPAPIRSHASGILGRNAVRKLFDPVSIPLVHPTQRLVCEFWGWRQSALR